MSFFECKTCRPPTSAVVHLQSALFGQALLWHRCCKKEIKPEEQSYRTPSLSLFCPGFKREFSLEETLTGFPKTSDKYSCPKSIFESQVRPLCVEIHLCGQNKSLVWLDGDSLQQDERDFTVCPHSWRVHIKPAKSEEDNLKNIFFSPPGSPSTPGPDGKCLFYGQSNKDCQRFPSWVSKVGDVTTLIPLCEVEWDPQPEDWSQIAALKWPTRAEEQPEKVYGLSELEVFCQRADFLLCEE